MTTPVVLVTDDLAPAALDALGPCVQVRRIPAGDRAALLAAAPGAHALLAGPDTDVDATVITAARDLKILARHGTGPNHRTDLPAATRAGITVLAPPAPQALSVAELTCGLIIATARHIPQAHTTLTTGTWNRTAHTGTELLGKTLGVIGLSTAGHLVAQRMSAFGMHILAHDPTHPTHAADTHAVDTTGTGATNATDTADTGTTDAADTGATGTTGAGAGTGTGTVDATDTADAGTTDAGTGTVDATGATGAVGVRIVTLEELLGACDVITLHEPAGPATLPVLGHDHLRRVKPTALIISAEHAGALDHRALARALDEGRIAGAALDIPAAPGPHTTPASATLASHPRVVATPALATRTTEARERAHTQAAHAVRHALQSAHDPGPHSINLPGAGTDPQVTAFVPLARHLGRILTALGDGTPPQGLRITTHGDLTRHDTRLLQAAALAGILDDLTDERVTPVNAPLIAHDHDIDVHPATAAPCPHHRTTLSVRAHHTDGRTTTARATVTGPRARHRLTGIDDHDLDLPLDTHTHLLLLRYKDTPGMIGAFGRVLGDLNLNIAHMQVSRTTEGGEALAAITLDTTPTPTPAPAPAHSAPTAPAPAPARSAPAATARSAPAAAARGAAGALTALTAAGPGVHTARSVDLTDRHHPTPPHTEDPS
ncbi:NAD(P)-dependent oxidoreductase [Kitasatospora sp. NPDC059462]|uniref:NAD(P)-dependent oxidoreductase n=1 Tax=Kitasatospora sp. NPDC059462 TaxID=3346841 RepID=UPI003694B2B2